MSETKTHSAAKTSVKDAPAKPAAAAVEAKQSKSGVVHKAGPKPKLSQDQRDSLGQRKAKSAARPAFRRHEWWRYKKLGGKTAPWRVPSGIHSKVRRHFRYRPPVVSIGYRGPEDVRGLHPSGFAEVLVYNEADLAKVEKTTQAARIGGTVGGRKAKLIVAAAAKLGIRVLNAPSEVES